MSLSVGRQTRPTQQQQQETVIRNGRRSDGSGYGQWYRGAGSTNDGLCSGIGRSWPVCKCAVDGSARRRSRSQRARRRMDVDVMMKGGRHSARTGVWLSGWRRFVMRGAGGSWGTGLAGKMRQTDNPSKLADEKSDRAAKEGGQILEVRRGWGLVWIVGKAEVVCGA
ncbi:uncharacterized protein LY79DRAFT_141746 [Colletotrichum navitas]|uniref:Uncharacterized protein n=1 Tax=Colletotrichum navitas TaxID=681940 RepID=A0AAD8VBV4_9PEZI|nr:uncharacterized protein LY79DRAFT_141746 [Colletotrichum navitas]KAK1599463.1 hypothetical protein LY79DRAFT_141746 [Colletotrichum navitas]